GAANAYGSISACLCGMTLSAVSNKTWAECRSDLELLESGRMQNRERRDGGAWVDTTQRELDWHKKTIGMYEVLVRKLRAEHGGGYVRRASPDHRTGAYPPSCSWESARADPDSR